MTLERQVRLLYWVMTAIAVLAFLATTAMTIIAAETLYVHGVDLRNLSIVFFGMYFAAAPLFWFLRGADLMEVSIKRISDGSRPGPRLRIASFEPPRRERS
jgi:hypothetical protein